MRGLLYDQGHIWRWNAAEYEGIRLITKRLDQFKGRKDRPLRLRRAERRGAMWLRCLGIEREERQERERPTCVLVQIDGLSHDLFKQGLATGKLPFLASLLREGSVVEGPWRAMLPTSTAVFQAGLFYGDNENMPGFFWYDKTQGREIRMNGARDTAELEDELQKRVAPFPGLLDGGSSYSALFAGGAKQTLLTFSRLFRPSLNVSLTPRGLMLFICSQVFLFARLFYYSAIELCLALYDLVTGLFTENNKFIEFKFLFPRIASVVFCREIATLAAIVDIYRGAGPIYLNYFAYDEHAHHRGPGSKFAMWTLRGIDASIRRIWRAARIAKHLDIREYDVYVWSDHGQTPTVPFQELFEMEPERHYDLLFRMLHGETPEQRRRAQAVQQSERMARSRVIRGQRNRRSRAHIERQSRRAEQVLPLAPNRLGRWLDRLLRPGREIESYPPFHRLTDPERFLSVISTGPVANLYVLHESEPMTYEQWEAWYPDFLWEMANTAGAGFVLIRGGEGTTYIGAGGVWFGMDDGDALRERLDAPTAEIVRMRRTELERWAHMPAAGDMVLFGQRDAQRKVISYTYERGGHAGPSREETRPFLIAPATRISDWPELVSDPGAVLELWDLHHRLRNLYADHPKNKE